MPLPFREDNIELPFNRKLAESRLDRLKNRFARDAKYKIDYVAFIDDMIKKGYAERVPKAEGKPAWYIPHHGVYHPRKPNKITVVFDCSAEFQGESLNRHILQGPDLTNTLVGVLSRFRQDKAAFMCDIESMFHQVRVSEEHRDYLRFLWSDDGDVFKESQEFRMKVHLFGATSSPGCSNLALKTTAEDNEEEVGSEAAAFLKNDFYVDDGLKSVGTTEKAIELIKTSKEMCRKGGFHLHKFVSNEKQVIESIPVEDRAKEIKELDLDHDVLPIERVLGVQWCIESDSFQFRITLKDKPLTRRGVLATVSSIYDPLGFVAPVLLTGKKILQSLCKDSADWDDPLPVQLRAQWERWRVDIHLLGAMKIPRCFKPRDFGDLKEVELHHFSDASTEGYGQCSYLRLLDDKNQIHSSLLMGKARVTPLKQVSIPRLELTAALVSVKVSATFQNELDYSKVKELFWTDSKVVLGYINNDARRFHVFVANRVQQIRDHTSPDQWNYIQSKLNPADDASRGLKARELINDSRWINGPAFLQEPHEDWNDFGQPSEAIKLQPDDSEVRKSSVLTTSVKKIPSMVERLEYFSSLHRAKRAFAVCLRYRRLLLERVRKKGMPNTAEQEVQPNQKYESVTVEEMESAEQYIVKLVQK